MGQARVSDMLCVMVNMQHQGKIITIRIWRGFLSNTSRDHLRDRIFFDGKDREKNTEFGRYFGIQGSTGREALKRGKTRIKSETKFRKEIEVLKNNSLLNNEGATLRHSRPSDTNNISCLCVNARNQGKVDSLLLNPSYSEQDAFWRTFHYDWNMKIPYILPLSLTMTPAWPKNLYSQASW